MFLASIGKKGLLQERPDANILKNVDLPVKQTVLSEMVQYLYACKADLRRSLPTDAHVRFMMEFIGSSFSLPLAGERFSRNRHIAKLALEIYSSWLIETKTSSSQRPKPIGDNIPFYYSEILQQLSLIFGPNAWSSRSSAHPRGHHSQSSSTLRADGISAAALCSRALRIFRDVAEVCRKDLPSSVWDKLLRVVLGVADAMLSRRKCPFGERFEKEVISTIFFVWLNWPPSALHPSSPGSEGKDGTSAKMCKKNSDACTDPELWQTFQRFAKHWLHSEEFLRQWKEVCRKLTHTVITLMYPREKSLNTLILWRYQQMKPIRMKFTRRQAIYLWHQSFHLIESAGLISGSGVRSRGVGQGGGVGVGVAQEPGSGTCFRIMVECIVDIVDCFLNVGKANRAANTQYPPEACPKAFVQENRNKSSARGANSVVKPWLPPDGTFILRAYGDALLDVANTHSAVTRGVFEDGRALALGCLCRLYSQQNGQHIKDEELGKFYQTILQALGRAEKSRSRVVSSVIINSATLFAQPLKGIQYLIPYFMRHLKNVLRNPDAESEVRFGAISIVNSLLPLRAHFYDASTMFSLRTEHASDAASGGDAAQGASGSGGGGTQGQHEGLGRVDEMYVQPEGSGDGFEVMNDAVLVERALSDPPPPDGEAPPPPPPQFDNARKGDKDKLLSSAGIETKIIGSVELPTSVHQSSSVVSALMDIPDLLVRAMQNEKNTYLQELLMWTLALQVHESAKEVKPAGGRALATCVIEYPWSLISKSGRQSNQAKRVAFSVLADVAHAHMYFKKQCPDHVKKFIGELCSFVSNFDERVGKQSEKCAAPRRKMSKLRYSKSLMYAATTCLLRWLAAAPWLFAERTLSSSIARAAVAGLKSKNRQVLSVCLKIEHIILCEVGRRPNEVHPLATPAHPDHPLYEHLKDDESLRHLSLREFVPNRLGERSPVAPFTHQALLKRFNEAAEACAKKGVRVGQYDEDLTHHFIIDGRVLVSAFESVAPRGADAGSWPLPGHVLLVTRDITGRYIWTASPAYVEKRDRAAQSDNAVTTTHDEAESKTVLGRCDTSDDAMAKGLLRSAEFARRGRSGQITHSEVLDSLGAYAKWQTSEFTRAVADRARTDVTQPPESKLTDTSAKALGDANLGVCARPRFRPDEKNRLERSFQYARMLFSNMGFVAASPAPRPSFTFCPSSLIDKLDESSAATTASASPRSDEPQSNFPRILPLRSGPELAHAIRTLDRLPTRVGVTVAVLLRKRGQSREVQMCDNIGGGQEYVAFLKQLGSSVRLESHQGFRGGLTLDDGGEALYSGDSEREIVFHVPTMLKSNLKRRKGLVLNNDVRIIWSEDPTDYNPDFGALERDLPEDQAERRLLEPRVYIVVWPLGNGLHRTRVYVRELVRMAVHQRGPSVMPSINGRHRQSGGDAPVASGGRQMGGSSDSSTSFNIFNRRKERDLPRQDAKRRSTTQDEVRAYLRERVQPVTPQDVFGPLLNDSVINETSLGFLIRSTCVNALKAVVKRDSFKSEYKKRATQLRLICDEFKDTDRQSTPALLESMFDNGYTEATRSSAVPVD